MHPRFPIASRHLLPIEFRRRGPDASNGFLASIAHLEAASKNNFHTDSDRTPGRASAAAPMQAPDRPAAWTGLPPACTGHQGAPSEAGRHRPGRQAVAPEVPALDTR